MSSVLSMLMSEIVTLPTPKEHVFTQTKISSDPDFGNKLIALVSQEWCFYIAIIHILF
ncbi:hypothetical protein GIB67_027250 [Kingdonia uniflora]|uniref:Uncharacterized protein n=1 Tax=Kingdonia uniflora TaxID=39325 RepID=A0A7J7KYD1_9MAGN|nr:hypothetical protein GIB67_027250 [Kingdonia uniflora]